MFSVNPAGLCTYVNKIPIKGQGDALKPEYCMEKVSNALHPWDLRHQVHIELGPTPGKLDAGSISKHAIGSSQAATVEFSSC